MTVPLTAEDTKMTPEILKERAIYADDRTLALLPYTWLGTDEFDILDHVLELPEGKKLEINIGTGITYKAAYYGDECAIEATVVAPGDGFVYPLTITILVSHEPNKPTEHNEFCGHSWAEWMKDEEGNEYVPRFDANMEYDEETDTYTVAEKDRDYDPECNCEYYEDANKVFTIKDDADLKAVTEFIGLAVIGELPEQIDDVQAVAEI